MYTIIAKNLIAKDGRMVKIRPSKPELSFKARKQVVLMLGAVVLSFFVCLIPFRLFTLWIVFVPDENVKSFGLESYYNFLYFSRIMLYLNSAINPILYNLMSSKFRKGFRKLFCSCWHLSAHYCRTEPGHLPTLNATMTNTTTTTSVASQNICKRLSNSRTLSQDDVKNNIGSSAHIESKSIAWEKCDSLHTSKDATETYRNKSVLKGTNYYKRQRSSQSTNTSCDEDNTEMDKIYCAACSKLIKQHSSRITFSTSCESNNENDKQETKQPNLTIHSRKKKLKFQHCFDEDKIIQLNSVATVTFVKNENGETENVTDDEHDQHIVPFLS